MFNLLMTIALNALIFAGFKTFDRFRIDNLQAIVTNYWVCVITGSIYIGRLPLNPENLTQPWFPWSLLMGAGFIGIFNLIAYCTRLEGITITTIANKLSLVIPVAFALWLYGDKISWLKATGLLLAIPAVYLSSKTKDVTKGNRNIWLALLLFFASGLLDTLVNYVAHHFFTTNNPIADERDQSLFLTHTFAMAAFIGTVLVVYLLAKGRRKFEWKNILAGVLLGVPNFFSMYFFIRLLQSGFLPGSAAIPVNNIGIVLAASLTAILFFKEKINSVRLVGMLLSVIAILFIMLSDLHA